MNRLPTDIGPSFLGIRLDTAVFLAAIPASAYLLVLMFDTGYSHFFRLNPEFIKPDPFSFFYIVRSAVTAVVATFIDMGQVAVLSAPSVDNAALDSRLVNMFGALLMLVLAWVAAVARTRQDADVYERFWGLQTLLVSTMILLIGSFFVAPFALFLGAVLIYLSYYKLFPALARALDKIEKTITPNVAARRQALMEAVPQQTETSVRVVCGLLIALSPMYYFGYESAKTQRQVLISQTRPAFALVKISGNYLIAAPVISTKNQMLHVGSGLKTFSLGAPETPLFLPQQFYAITVGERSEGFSGLPGWLQECIIY